MSNQAVEEAEETRGERGGEGGAQVREGKSKVKGEMVEKLDFGER